MCANFKIQKVIGHFPSFSTVLHGDSMESTVRRGTPCETSNITGLVGNEEIQSQIGHFPKSQVQLSAKMLTDCLCNQRWNQAMQACQTLCMLEPNTVHLPGSLRGAEDESAD